jgi:hypothetical protein
MNTRLFDLKSKPALKFVSAGFRASNIVYGLCFPRIDYGESTFAKIIGR